jgi:hypothetical protein
VKGDKVVAFCDRHCNVIAPFVTPGAGNRNESPLLREALPQLTRIARAVGMDLRGTIVRRLDGVYDCRSTSLAYTMIVRHEVACRSRSHFNGGNHPCHRVHLRV